MLKNSKNSFASINSLLRPFILAMLFVFGFHLFHLSEIYKNNSEGTFYEICNTKVSIPHISLQISHHSDLATFETEEEEEKSETSLNYGLLSENIPAVPAFFKISGAANQSLKIPSFEGKAPLYILFKNFRVHLA